MVGVSRKPGTPQSHPQPVPPTPRPQSHPQCVRPRPRCHLTLEHGLLLLGGADEAADALNDLALRIHLLLPGLLAQEDGGHCRERGRRWAKGACSPAPGHPHPGLCSLCPGEKGLPHPFVLGPREPRCPGSQGAPCAQVTASCSPCPAQCHCLQPRRSSGPKPTLPSHSLTPPHTFLVLLLGDNGHGHGRGWGGGGPEAGPPLARPRQARHLHGAEGALQRILVAGLTPPGRQPVIHLQADGLTLRPPGGPARKRASGTQASGPGSDHLPQTACLEWEKTPGILAQL